MRPDELSNEPVRHSDRTEAATAAQGSRGVPSGVPAGAAGPTSESGGQQPEKHQSGSRRSSLPAGRYGNVFVHRDGSSTTVLKGEAENVPSNERLGKVMSIASPEVPTARSQRTGAGARTGGDVQRGSRPRAGGSTGQTPPTPPQTPEQGQPQRPGPRRSSSVGSQSQASRTQARHAEERLRRAEQTRQTATQQNSRAAEKGNQQRGSTSPAPASPSRPQAQSPRPPRSQPSKQVPKGAAPQEPKPQKSTKPQQSRVEQAAEKHRGSDR